MLVYSMNLIFKSLYIINEDYMYIKPDLFTKMYRLNLSL